MLLDRRKQTLLHRIVETYVERAEPVGSHFLAGQGALGVGSATIRSELAEMTELGYLAQPHTSAGRVPTDMGYRYYVDHLMVWDRLSPSEAHAIRAALRACEGDVEELLTQTCRVLSSLTRYTTMATPPSGEEPAVKQVHLVLAGPRRILAVVVLDNGHVVHRFAEAPRAVTTAEVNVLGNLLDSLLEGVRAGAVAETAAPQESVAAQHDLLRILIGVIGRGVVDETSDLYLEGASRMLEQPEFQEATRVEPLVRFLEERKSAYELLRDMLASRPLTVSIGSENPHDTLRSVSLVAARYQAGVHRHGWIGVIGPTRMYYDQAVPMVQYAARILGESLGRLGVQ